AGFGGTLVGLFIGLALGLALAVGVAYYLSKAGIAYQVPAARDSTKDPGRPGRTEPTSAEKPRFDFYRILPGIEEPKIGAKPAGRGTPDRPTVERAASPDKSTPKVDERAASPDKSTAKVDERLPAAAAQSAATADKPQRAAERFWLQAGS